MNSQTLPQKFRTAIISGASINHLQRLSSKLQDIQCRDPSTRETSLMLATSKGRIDVCAWLILDENHEDVEISRDSAGETVLHIAASLGHLEIVELYLSQYPFVLEWTNLNGSTALHSAAQNGRIEIVSLLVEYGADMNSGDLKGNSPLMYASSWGQLKVVKMLIFLGADSNVVNNDGFSAVDYAYSFAGVKAIDEYVRQHYEAQKQQRRNLRKQSKMSTTSDHFDPSPRISRPELLHAGSSSVLFDDSPILGYRLDENDLSPNTSGFSFQQNDFSPTSTQINNLPFPATTHFNSTSLTSKNILADLTEPLTLSPLSNREDMRRSLSKSTSSRTSSIISTNSNLNLSPLATRNDKSRSNSTTSPPPRTTTTTTTTTILPLSISIPHPTSGPTSAKNRRETSSSSSPGNNSHHSDQDNSTNSYNSNSTHWIGSPIDPNFNSNINTNTNTNTNTTVTPSTPRPTISSNPSTQESIKSSTTLDNKEGKEGTKVRNGSSDTTGSKMARAFGLRRKKD